MVLFVNWIWFSIRMFFIDWLTLNLKNRTQFIDIVRWRRRYLPHRYVTFNYSHLCNTHDYSFKPSFQFCGQVNKYHTRQLRQQAKILRANYHSPPSIVQPILANELHFQKILHPSLCTRFSPLLFYIENHQQK